MKFLKIILLLLLVSILTSTFAQRFTAYYTKVENDFPITGMIDDELFGKYADLIVEVMNKVEIRFTHGTSYLPEWKSANGNFPFEKIIERYGDGEGERPDIISRYSHVRLINKSDEVNMSFSKL